jgi:hypothetical protein
MNYSNYLENDRTQHNEAYKLGFTEFCGYEPIEGTYSQQSYPVDIKSSIPPEYWMSNPNERIPDPPANGGIFGGPQSNKPWANIPVVPTMTNLIHNNLRSANPPPGATTQYINGNRLGNNIAPMPMVYWYGQQGMTQNLKVIKNSDSKK